MHSFQTISVFTSPNFPSSFHFFRFPFSRAPAAHLEGSVHFTAVFARRETILRIVLVLLAERRCTWWLASKGKQGERAAACEGKEREATGRTAMSSPLPVSELDPLLVSAVAPGKNSARNPISRTRVRYDQNTRSPAHTRACVATFESA